jgi:hypothetical protein
MCGGIDFFNQNPNFIYNLNKIRQLHIFILSFNNRLTVNTWFKILEKNKD